MNDFRFIDLFCGGGGSITGAINALRSADMRYDGRCFNHWDLAIRTIRANHPECVPDYDAAVADIDHVSPWKVFADDSKRLDVLWASPSCTHHSRARGGVPKEEQFRAQPEYIIPFLRFTNCRRLYVENVDELLEWGPLLKKDIHYKGKLYRAGQPDPRKKGILFNAWYRTLRACGYKVEYQILNAADYGAATNRKRLIVQAVDASRGEKIIWPEPTHVQDPGLLSASYLPWRSAAEIIDWSIPGRSIFDREKPLCENTLRRIEAGIKKYWGAWAEPFLIVLRGTGRDHINSTAVPLSAPLPTITTGGGHLALISPIFMDQSHPADPTDASRVRTGPLGTLTTSNNWSVVRPFLTRYNGGENRNHAIDTPMPVIDCSNRYGVIQPFLMSYYSTGTTTATDRTVPTITTRDRFGLIQGQILTMPDGQQFRLDITHRMLTARELAAATGFPPGYIFVGGDTAAKKMIGNAVPPPLAEALYLSA